MTEMHEMTDAEVESVCGGVYDLGGYITAIGDVISAALGGNCRTVDPGMTPSQPKGIVEDPGFSPRKG